MVRGACATGLDASAEEVFGGREDNGSVVDGVDLSAEELHGH